MNDLKAKTIICLECREDFIFDVGEQEFFQEKGFVEPKRCPNCRRKRREEKEKKERENGNG